MLCGAYLVLVLGVLNNYPNPCYLTWIKKIEEPGNDRFFLYNSLFRTHSNQERDNEIYHFSFPESIEEIVE